MLDLRRYLRRWMFNCVKVLGADCNLRRRGFAFMFVDLSDGLLLPALQDDNLLRQMPQEVPQTVRKR